ncbi:sodium/potassium/calcium exchanger 4-like [Liolophura sinensis]|uniref:sodium/potassium/calcium exchanger 4-like n=1 Tax=Liolophura sinensis TaxID=3198878 RepID=UPI00315816E2
MDMECQSGRRKYRTRKRKTRLVLVACVYLSLIAVVFIARGVSDYYDKNSLLDDRIHRLNKRAVENGEHRNVSKSEDPEVLNCTPRAIYEFPENFFTLQETQDGGVVIHILIALYMFCSLAIVCDDYFVASLEMICDSLGLQEDVAGATFMAAGSSAPELFTSVIGMFRTRSDVGIGTIVGSAVFNILFIISLCALFSGMVVYLTWWPMTRDCLFYLISIITLIVVMNDELVHWYEALVMLVLYVLYITIMYFNRRLEAFFTAKAKLIPIGWLQCNYSTNQEKNPLLKTQNGTTPKPSPEGAKPGNGVLQENGYQETEFGALPEQHENRKTHAHEEFDNPWTIPDSFLGRIYWVGMIPIKALLFITIPDCRRPGCWQKLFALTFIMSIVWIAAFSYLMVWMVTITGDALGIPDTVMGLTLLAAGTSVPDALSSLFVSRDGLGDMAVSNSIGSNVFDILLCLGLPWLLKTVAVESGSVVEINSKGLVFSAITLLTTVAFVLIATHLNRWRLTKWIGVFFLVIYLIVITFACLYELNVFGELNLPACPRR